MSDSKELVLALPTPEAFPAFPYVPYSIQLDLMQHVYSAIESSKVAIIESPTGTGKTLSLLCSSLAWLNDEKDRAKSVDLRAFRAHLPVGDEPAWVLEQTISRYKQQLEAKDEEMKARLETARSKEEELRKAEGDRSRKRRRIEAIGEELDTDEEESFLPADGARPDDAVLPQTKELLNKWMQGKRLKHTEVELEGPACTKVYYSSRTHSQLSQLVTELRKTSLASSTRFVPLGSRKNLCINHDLRHRAGGDLDEACRELLSDKKGKGCPFLPGEEEESRMMDFRDHILAVPRDIEDLVVLGEELKTCPYYGSRRAIRQAELVSLPYNLLLQKSAREALDIDLSGHVVIIDEAHNLIDTVLGIHSLTLSTRTLEISLHQLGLYVARFRKRLGARHLLHLQRLILFLTAILKFCVEWHQSTVSDKTPPHTEPQAMMTAPQVTEALGQKVDGINLIEICAYLKQSKIAHKISGYSEKREADTESAGSQTVAARKASPPLHAVEAFLLALMNNDEDGRVHLSQTTQDDVSVVQIRYQLLNPARHFKDVIDEARSIVLAGGTMEPISDFRNQLFPQLEQVRLSSLTCGHVIPKDNLTAIAIPSGPRGGELIFKYASRGDKAMMGELGQTLLNLLSLVPDGVVVFLPSYAFLGQLKEIWSTDGTLAKLAAKKRVFFEPQENGTVEEVLREYSESIRTLAGLSTKKSGAVLFAVVGAKLSEGLNFSDELARAVIVVGLPFANLGSVELRERMKYVREISKNGQTNEGKDAGLELYENLCMKAVNQSIGRAIRHRGDWAALILLDKRYSSPHIRKKLPQWINQELRTPDHFGGAIGHLGAFYRQKRQS